MLNKGLRVAILALSIILGRSNQSLPIKYDVNCRTLAGLPYQVLEAHGAPERRSQKLVVFLPVHPRGTFSILWPDH